MPSEIWFWLFVVSTSAGSAWSIFREIQISRLYQESRQVQLVLRTIAKRINSSRASVRKEFEDLRRLIEKTANQAQLDRIEVGLSKHGPTVQVSTGDNAANQAGENRHEQR